MIGSMTAFAREQSHGDWGSASWEIRTVNHRYLDVAFKLPDGLQVLEPALRERLQKKLKRGRVECRLQFKPQEKTGKAFELNEGLVLNLARAAEKVANIANARTELRAYDILRWPEVVQQADIELEQFTTVLLDSFEQALNAITAMRQTEGTKLSTFLSQQLQAISDRAKILREMQPVILAAQQKKITERFEQAQLECDPQRLEQEMVLIAQKIDATEELDRLNAHTTEVESILTQGGTVGRKLDFLMQELNREINTFAAKSLDAKATSIAVQIKVLLEQMREQIQNIE